MTLRAVLLGLLGVTFICGFTPFNDYVLDSTYVVGNFLPIGLLLFFLLFIFIINAPLLRYLPKFAFTVGELTVALSMTLVSCCLPSSSLMRYLPAGLAITPWVAANNNDVAKIYDDPTRADDPEYAKDIDRHVRLPDWMFPTRDPALPKGPVSMADRGREPVFTQWRDRVPAETFWGHVQAVPWKLWKTPAIAWSLFLIPMFTAVILMTVLIRHQWVDNERLPFPLATVYLSLIEAPPPGKPFNALFSKRSFWIAFLCVFTIHAFNGFHAYWPRFIPNIPINFNLIPVFANHPGIYYVETTALFTSTIYFSVIGVSYFLQSKISFSLFGTFLLYQLLRYTYGVQKLEFKNTMREDQMVGSALTVGMIVLWIGRKHWMLIIRQMIRGARINEPLNRYVSYRAAGWGLLICLALLVIWLCVAGTTLIGAVAFVLYMGLMYLVLTRVVAETGMIFAGFYTVPNRLWLVPLEVSTRLRTTANSYFITRFIGCVFYDNRESLCVYSSHALKIADHTLHPEETSWRKTYPFIAALALALVVGLVISYASTLYVNYTYSETLSNNPSFPLNGNSWFRLGEVYANTVDYLDPAKPRGRWEGHSHLSYVASGALVTAIFGFLRLRFAAWPFHPIGVLMGDTYPVGTGWFSILLGWLSKILIVRFGGAQLYKQAQSFFIGLIVGEATAAAFWMLFSVLRYASGQTYYPMRLLPG